MLIWHHANLFVFSEDEAIKACASSLLACVISYTNLLEACRNNTLWKMPQIACRRGENLQPFFFSLAFVFTSRIFCCGVEAHNVIRGWIYARRKLILITFIRCERGQMFESLYLSVLLVICYSFSTLPSDPSGRFSSLRLDFRWK